MIGIIGKIAAGICVMTGNGAERAICDLAAGGGLGNCGESFTPGTKVLMASGATVPIAGLKPGDKVLATNVKTGKTQAETVSAVLARHDHDLYNLTIRAGPTALKFSDL